MKQKIAWVTDSAATLSMDFCKNNHVYILPMNVVFGDTSFKEEIDITKEVFYQKLKGTTEDTKTSQPAFGDFINLYEQLKKEYSHVIAIHASSELTGTYQSSNSAKEMIKFGNAVVLDSRIGDYPLGEMIRRGVSMLQEGKDFSEIVETLAELPKSAELFLLPANLDQLKKSGRVSSAQNLFASLLNIKLVCKFVDGKVVVDEKVRSEKKAKQLLFGKIREAYQKGVRTICISHAENRETAQCWKEEIEGELRGLEVEVQLLACVAGVHAGFGTMAVSWIR